MDSAEIRNEYERRDPVADLFGDEVYMDGGLNEIATDYVISTGKDSLFINGMAFQHAFKENYEVAPSPNPPSRFEVVSRPDMIELKWSYEDYPTYEPSSSELAGFKIYRAFGGTQYELTAEGTAIGDWQVIDSVGYDVRRYADTIGVVRGDDYYYCLTTVSPSGGESGKWITMTQEPFSARLLRKLPGECIIRIFTESGELIQTIEHTDGSGTAFWQVMGSGGYYMTTVNNQRPASGIYIAHIQIPETGEYVTRKFIIVR
ncbi:MAG: hypothetical protein P8Z50_08515, partial [candidate division WOR-3 bacterium]